MEEQKRGHPSFLAIMDMGVLTFFGVCNRIGGCRPWPRM